MAYGDYDGPDKPNKGKRGGACNRGLCQAEPANWWNRGSLSWYCASCAHTLNTDRFNKREAERLYGGPLCVEEVDHQHDARILAKKIGRAARHELMAQNLGFVRYIGDRKPTLADVRAMWPAVKEYGERCQDRAFRRMGGRC